MKKKQNEKVMKMSTAILVPKNDELYHFGIKGMRWGVRRYQNKDGSLTNLGRKRYSSDNGTLNEEGQKIYNSKKSALEAKKQVLQNRANTRQQIKDLKALDKEVSSMEKADKKAVKADKKAEKQAKKNEKKEAKGQKQEEHDAESLEKKREKVLKSSDAEYIYKHKDLLTTAELNDRINRIDTEAKLKSRIPQQETGLAYINNAMKGAAYTINNAKGVFESVDNAYKSVSNSKMGSTLKKALGIEDDKKAFNYDERLSKIDKMSNQEVQEFKNRVVNENAIRNIGNNIKKMKSGTSDEESEASTFAYEAGKKAVDDYNKNWYENDQKVYEAANKATTYAKTGKDVVDSTLGTSRSKPETNTSRLLETVEHVSGTVEGKGTSTVSKVKDFMDDNPVIKEAYNTATSDSEAVGVVKDYIAGYLEDYSKYFK